MANVFDQFDKPQQNGAAPAAPVQPQKNVFDKFDKKTEEQAKLEEGTWYDDPMMASRMVLDGVWFGWADELGAHAATAMVKVMGHGGDKSYGEIYDEIYGTIKAEEQAYKKDHGTAAAVLSGVGSVASPANFIAPGGGFTAQVGRAGVEGAVYGAGEAGEGNRLMGAVEGGAWGAGTGTAMQGLGFMYNGLKKQRIAQELGSGDNFIPITQAANPGDATESFFHSIYRDVVGPSWGGQATLKQQERRLLSPLASKSATASERLAKAQRNAKDAVAQVRKTNASARASAESEAKQVFGSTKAALDEGLENIKIDFKSESALVPIKAARTLDQVTEEAAETFRVKAFLEAIPEGTPVDKIDDVIGNLNTSPNKAMRMVDDLWSENGFKMLSDRKFQINADDIEKKMMARLKEDPLFDLTGTADADIMMQRMKQIIQENTNRGWIDGQTLSKIRSSLGSKAAQFSDQGGSDAVKFTMLRELQDVLNDHVKSKLSGAAREAFDAHVAGWKANVTLRGAVTSASRKAGGLGKFGADDWVSSIAKNSPRDARQGSGVLRAEADGLAVMLADRNKALQTTADTALMSLEKNKAAAIKANRAAVAKAKAKLEQEKIDINRSSDSALNRQVRLAENKSKIVDLERQDSQLNEMYTTLKKQSASDDNNIFKRIAANGTLGSMFGSSVFALADVATLSAGGRALASQPVQRFIAGQTALQRLLQRTPTATQARQVFGSPLQSSMSMQGVGQGISAFAGAGQVEDPNKYLIENDPLKNSMQSKYGMLTGQ